MMMTYAAFALSVWGAAVSSALSPPANYVSPSAEVVKKLYLYSQYSGAAYCNNNDQSDPGTPLNCSTGNCPDVQANGAKYLGGFLNSPPFESTCYMAVDPTEENLVLACRGASGTGFATAALTEMMPCESMCANCSCYAGFYDSWVLERERVKTLVEAAQKQYPGYPLVVTGHSLGAAQSFYAAAELRNNGTACTLYNYGQPHLGNLALARHVTDQGNNYRVTHTDDPAPRIGPVALGYRHSSPEYWIFHDEPGFVVQPTDIAIIEGFNNATGNQGTGGFDAAAHTQYFQPNLGSCYLPSQL